MATIYNNHVHVHGDEQKILEFLQFIRANSEAIGKGSEFEFDPQLDYETHRALIEFIHCATGIKIDRVRLKKKASKQYTLSVDSWNQKFGNVVCWIAEHNPDLRFVLESISDSRAYDTIIFQHGNWCAFHHEADEDDTNMSCELVAAGSLNGYSDGRLDSLLACLPGNFGIEFCIPNALREFVEQEKANLGVVT